MSARPNPKPIGELLALPLTLDPIGIVRDANERRVFYGKIDDTMLAMIRAINCHDELVAALRKLMNLPTEHPLRMTPDEREAMWAAHKCARDALAKAGSPMPGDIAIDKATKP